MGLLAARRHCNSSGVCQVDVRGRRGIVALQIEQSRLQIDDIDSQVLILDLQRLIIGLGVFGILNLLLELLDIAFLALPERSL